jgi:hypothetical protein
MDLSVFTLNPVTLAILILGVVEFIKRLGLTGNKLMLVSMAVGIMFATVYKVHDLYPPAEPYLEVFFFGIAAGLCASGIYSFITNRFPDQTKEATMKYTKIVKTRRGGSQTRPEDKEVE